MKYPWFALVLISLPCLAAPVQPGETVFHETFESSEVLRPWRADGNPRVRRERGYESDAALEVAVTNGRGQSVQIPLPVERIRGARIRCEAMVKAINVTTPPKPWNGIKCMLHISGPAGAIWPQQNNVSGTFDWKKIGFTARISRDATNAELVLGLEQVTGTVRFDDVKITVVNPPRIPTIGAASAGPVFKGHDKPRLRGAMIGSVNAADLREFGRQWHANHVRWQLLWAGFPHSPADKGDLAAYDKWMEGQIERLDALLPVCEEAGLLVLIDLHTPPGGRNAASECNLFHEKRFQESFIAWWDKLSKHFRGNKTVWGYDLVNEPVEGMIGEGCLTWNELAAVAARVIRTNDAEHAIVMEPEPWEVLNPWRTWCRCP